MCVCMCFILISLWNEKYCFSGKDTWVEHISLHISEIRLLIEGLVE